MAENKNDPKALARQEKAKKELETAIAAHEMQRLELKESFGAECIRL